MSTRNILLPILLTLTLTSVSQGYDDHVHFLAHMGVSYAGSNLVYQVMTKGLHTTKMQAFVFGAFTALTANLVYKMSERHLGGVEEAMLGSATGVALQGFTVLEFE